MKQGENGQNKQNQTLFNGSNQEKEREHEHKAKSIPQKVVYKAQGKTNKNR